jgi:hypothetical protein
LENKNKNHPSDQKFAQKRRTLMQCLAFTAAGWFLQVLSIIVYK